MTIPAPKSPHPYGIGEMHAQRVRAVGDAVGELGRQLEEEAAAAIERIEAAGYNEQVMAKEIRKLMRDNYARVGEAMGITAKLARDLAKQYSKRAKREATPSRVPKVWKGDAIAAQIPPETVTRVISKDLHVRAAKAAQEVVSQGMTAVREAKSLTEAATKLIHQVEGRIVGARTTKTRLGQGLKQTRLMADLERAGNALNARGGPRALKDWQAVRTRLRAYMRRLDESGRIKFSFLDLLQRTSDTSAKGINRALEQHAAFRQKYVAERIVRTEEATEFKRAQFAEDDKDPRIIGYYWRMMRAARRGYVKRTKVPKSGKSKRCVCELLDGTRVSKERAREKPMGHPHCMCVFEPIFERVRFRG